MESRPWRLRPLVGLGILALVTSGCAWVQRASVDSAGNQGNADSGSVDINGGGDRPAISANGRYIAFSSGASNLVAGDTNAAADVFLRDTVAGTTTRVSVTNAGNQSNDDGYEPAISADGHSVAFDSWASNLVAGDTNTSGDVFVRDTVAGTTTRASITSTGNQVGSTPRLR